MGGMEFTPAQLLGARHDTPDLTGAVIDFEPVPELAPVRAAAVSWRAALAIAGVLLLLAPIIIWP